MAVAISTRLVRMPNSRSGIIVRIVVVATRKTDANSAPAVPACCAIWEVSMGANQLSKKRRLEDSCLASPHHNARAMPSIYGQKATFCPEFEPILVWWFGSSLHFAANPSRELPNQNHTRIMGFYPFESEVRKRARS